MITPFVFPSITQNNNNNKFYSIKSSVRGVLKLLAPQHTIWRPHVCGLEGVGFDLILFHSLQMSLLFLYDPCRSLDGPFMMWISYDLIGYPLFARSCWWASNILNLFLGFFRKLFFRCCGLCCCFCCGGCCFHCCQHLQLWIFSWLPSSSSISIRSPFRSASFSRVGSSSSRISSTR